MSNRKPPSSVTPPSSNDPVMGARAEVLNGWMQKFLEVFAETCNINASARAANVSSATVDKYRKDHATFSEAYRAAEKSAVTKLEGIVFNRAMNGDRRLKFDPKTGKPFEDPETGKPYEEREFSDHLQITLLKAHRPEVYGEKSQVEVTHQFAQVVELRERLANVGPLLAGITALPECADTKQ